MTLTPQGDSAAAVVAVRVEATVVTGGLSGSSGGRQGGGNSGDRGAQRQQQWPSDHRVAQ